MLGVAPEVEAAWVVVDVFAGGWVELDDAGFGVPEEVFDEAHLRPGGAFAGLAEDGDADVLPLGFIAVCGDDLEGAALGGPGGDEEVAEGVAWVAVEITE